VNTQRSTNVRTRRDPTRLILYGILVVLFVGVPALMRHCSGKPSHSVCHHAGECAGLGSHCVVDGSEGYCTGPCDGHADCPTGWRWAPHLRSGDSQPTNVCLRP